MTIFFSQFLSFSLGRCDSYFPFFPLFVILFAILPLLDFFKDRYGSVRKIGIMDVRWVTSEKMVGSLFQFEGIFIANGKKV